MKIDTKLLGGILLIIGTTIGGGMLALPIATSKAGFINSIFLLTLCWLIMTTSALLMLEVNLWLPPNTNVISMVKTILGPWSAVLAWSCYLALFVCILAAYMAGGGGFLHAVLQGWGITLPPWVSMLLFTSFIAAIVYQGIQFVDYVNRGLMFGKLGMYALLIIAIFPSVSFTNLMTGHLRHLMGGVTITVTSFAFANIIPSLRTYFNDDIDKLRKVTIIGSLVPLICYVFWEIAIMGVIPLDGPYSLGNILKAGDTTGALVEHLSVLIHSQAVHGFAHAFTAICLATSFLACALGLSDFLADGLKTTKEGIGKLFICFITFAPSALLVILVPSGIFMRMLNYVGIYCTILFALFPSLMAWRGRYSKTPIAHGYQLAGGKLLLTALILTSTFLIVYGFTESFK